MRLRIILICAAIVASAAWIIWHRHTNAPPVGPTPPPGPYSDIAHIAWLQKLGYVPTNAPIRDRWLASRTSWWGKRLDPKEFWKDRVLWRDWSATAAAGSHGREYPPVPQDDPAIPYDDDRRPPYDPPEGYNIPSVSSSRERKFWEAFDRTHPRPPEWIESQQTSDTLSFRRSDALFFGCPAEALTDEAIYWANILKWRTRYHAALVLPAGDSPYTTNEVLAKASVDPKLLTEPLTAAQLKAANAWKLAYLQRLRTEKTDESYINAYVKAWNLSPAEVFPENIKD